MDEIISRAIASHKQALGLLEKNLPVIKRIAQVCIESLKNNGKIIFMGNGGSAADAQHLAAELVGRFKRERHGLASLALTANIAVLTAVGNDYGFEDVFSRQIEALAGSNDVVVGISTSGKSANVIKAVEAAKKKGVKTIGFLGKDGGDLKSKVDIFLLIDSNDTPRIQEMHICAGHIICEIIEEQSAAR